MTSWPNVTCRFLCALLFLAMWFAFTEAHTSREKDLGSVCLYTTKKARYNSRQVADWTALLQSNLPGESVKTRGEHISDCSMARNNLNALIDSDRRSIRSPSNSSLLLSLAQLTLTVTIDLLTTNLTPAVLFSLCSANAIEQMSVLQETTQQQAKQAPGKEQRLLRWAIIKYGLLCTAPRQLTTVALNLHPSQKSAHFFRTDGHQCAQSSTPSNLAWLASFFKKGIFHLSTC